MGFSQFDWVENYDPEKRFFSGKSYFVVKRLFDLTLVILASIVWLPLVLLIALAIKITSPGAPVMFSRLRAGRAGKLFRIYKFRTMVPNAEELKEKYAHLNELEWPDFKITNDPRVTPIGKILRKTSMDELPQLFNVLQGEMSLVGPRPTDFGPEVYRLWQTERLDVLPGITGLWQITARGSVNMDERTRMDITYIERASLLLDVMILLKTVGAVIKPRGTV